MSTGQRAVMPRSVSKGGYDSFGVGARLGCMQVDLRDPSLTLQQGCCISITPTSHWTSGNVTSSTQPEVHNVFQRHQSSDEDFSLTVGSLTHFLNLLLVGVVMTTPLR